MKKINLFPEIMLTVAHPALKCVTDSIEASEKYQTFWRENMNLPLKNISLALTGLLLFLVFACAGKTVPAASDGVKNVLCSFYPVYIMTKNVAVGVPDIRVKNLAPNAAGCLHDYNLTPADRFALDKADIFIVNGYGMENFLDKLLVQKPSMKMIVSTKGINPLVDGKSGQTNAHVWVSLKNAARQTQNIADGLAVLDPKNAPLYRRNAETYIRKLERLDNKFRQSLKGMTGSPVITFHEAFPYFASDIGLKIAAVVEREPGSEPGAAEMADTVKLIGKMKVKAVFAEPQYSPKSARAISRETGVPMYFLDPAVTGPDDVNAYLRIMETNLAVLLEALK